jgi:hypothetical protein
LRRDKWGPDCAADLTRPNILIFALCSVHSDIVDELAVFARSLVIQLATPRSVRPLRKVGVGILPFGLFGSRIVSHVSATAIARVPTKRARLTVGIAERNASPTLAA